MKSSLLKAMPFFTVLLFLLTSCNDNENKTDSNTGSDSAANNNATQTTAPNTNTIITTPQSMVIIKHKVKNFDAWKMAYESHDSARLANGLHNYVIGRSIEDTNTVLVSLKADDMAKAKAFTADPDLKQRMQKGGVIGAPSIEFITMTFQDTVTIGSVIRSETMFKVKDWATWEKNFKNGEQERLDNGIVTRAYGHDADDNNQIRLVTALVDTAKARAYWISDMLKKRRAAGGVVTEPERFLFNVVKRY